MKLILNGLIFKVLLKNETQYPAGDVYITTGNTHDQ
jgi:hypothetical protein